ncbi:MAG: glycosyltransferase, partial [candidate division WOR-3 bacterium]|nr:glycosyltransferase [candidate division WOR-3 bacterium]
MMAKSFYPVIGGVERTVYELARGLNRYYDITLLTVSEDRRFREESFDGIKVIKTPRFAKILSTPMSFNYPLWFKKLSINTDLIHLHSPHPVGELVLNTFPTYTKILTTYHFDIVKQSYLKWLYSPLLKTVFRKSQKIVTSNPNIIQTSSLLEDYQDKCIAIPFGIKISEYLLSQEQLKNALALKNKYSKPVILFVGRLVYYKGVEFLIKAMARIDANLIIIGEGPLRKRLGVLVNNLGIANKVEFIDHLPREDLLLYFNICDVFVLPSVAR